MNSSDPTSTRLLGPNGQLSDMAKKIVDRALQLIHTDRVHVARAAMERSGDVDDVSEHMCVEAVRDARNWAAREYSAQGELSAERFQDFLNAQPHPHPYPSRTRVLAILGGEGKRWTVARQRALGLPVVDPLVTRQHVRSAIRVGPELLKSRVAEFAAEIEHVGGPIAMDEFLTWCRSKACDVGEFEDPYPLSLADLEQHFDGWLHLLEESGVLGVNLPPRRLFVDTVPVQQLDFRAREMARAAHVMASQGKALTRKRVLAFYEDVTVDAHAGDAGGMSDKTFFRLFGEWKPFLRATGLVGARTGMEKALGIEIDTSTETRSADEEYSDEEILAFLRAVAQEHGRDAGTSHIKRFRGFAFAEAQKAGYEIELPEPTMIRDRFGSIPMAFASAGVISYEEAAIRGRPDYTEENRLDAFEAAIRHCGTAITPSTYRRYATGRRAAERAKHFPDSGSVKLLDEATHDFNIAKAIAIEKRGLADLPRHITDLKEDNRG